MASFETSVEEDSVLTAYDLMNHWKNMPSPKNAVCGFYGHAKGHFRCFSNFYENEPMTFLVPDCCWSEEFESHGHLQLIENITFSEKSIMLCKAALFRDREAFETIKSLKKPAQCKQAGRQVRNFDEEIWNRNVLTIAFQVVYQKFSQLLLEKGVLLSTNHCLIAEASPRDKVWGIGMGSSNPCAQDPKLWEGKNILGWALMKARATLQNEAEFNQSNKGQRNKQRSLSTNQPKEHCPLASSTTSFEKKSKVESKVKSQERTASVSDRAFIHRGAGSSAEEFPPLN